MTSSIVETKRWLIGASLAAVLISGLPLGMSYAEPRLDLSVRTLQGDLRSLKQYEGKVVYVDFWASWCAPCRDSFPWMEQMHQRYAEQGLAIVAINLDSDSEMAKPFLADFTSNSTSTPSRLNNT